MELFIVENNIVRPTAEALLLEPFNAIWENDETPKKDIALKKFAYVEFMCSYKKSNPFVGYTDETLRSQKILEAINMDNTLLDEKAIVDAMKLYITLQEEASPSLRFYKSAVEASEKMIEFFENFDLMAVNSRTGNLLYKPADITRALKDVNEILKTMTSLKEKVYQELYEDSKAKGGREVNYFEK